MKKQIITLRNQGKTWKEISSEVGGHPNYLSSKFGKKARRAKKLDLLGVVPSPLNRQYEEFDKANDKSAKDLVAAMRLIQELGGAVEF